MALLRAKLTKGFAHIPYEAIRDNRLKLKDKGFLCYLLTLPDGWDFSIDGMVVAIGTDGRDAISSCVKRLEECGYLHRERERDEHGHLRTARWTVSDHPMDINLSRGTGGPMDGLPTQENPTQDNPAERIIANNKYKAINSFIDNNNKKYISGIKERQYQRKSDFEIFWKAYPKKVGKKNAERAFLKLEGVSLDALLRAVEAQKNTRQWQEDGGRYIPNPSTWLNQGRWEDELPQQEWTPRGRAEETRNGTGKNNSEKKNRNPFLEMLRKEETLYEQETDIADAGNFTGSVPLSLQGHERR